VGWWANFAVRTFDHRKDVVPVRDASSLRHGSEDTEKNEERKSVSASSEKLMAKRAGISQK
jgi:hypothetical protein